MLHFMQKNTYKTIGEIEMITLSYKLDGKWTDVEGFETPSLAHAHAVKSGFHSYKLMDGTKPLGVYVNNQPKPKTKANKEPKVTLEELAEEWDNE